ncbi:MULTISPECIES: hypothetical protein [Blautia]|uniref:hypothetical protein n=1 Tax=Blautia TaxID=572511 RepID=UPI000BA413F9|nr:MULTISPECIES: hypothetical protein [Blautia]
MEQNNKKTPIGAFMDLAKEEIGNCIATITRENGIPADLTVYILDSIRADYEKAKAQYYVNNFAAVQEPEPRKEIMHEGGKED